MKRLAMLMIIAMTMTVTAQGKDFNGSWVLDVEKSGSKNGPPEMTVTLNAKELAVTAGTGERAQTLRFALDGTETDMGNGRKGKAAWKGDKLVTTLTTSRGPVTVTLWREGVWLVQEAGGGGESTKLYFKKAPAK